MFFLEFMFFLECRTGHGRGTDQKRQSKSRAERGQKAGQGIVQYK